MVAPVAVTKRFGALDALGQGQQVFELGEVMRGQTGKLFHVENRVSLHERDFVFDVRAFVVRLGAGEASGEKRERLVCLFWGGSHPERESQPVGNTAQTRQPAKELERTRSATLADAGRLYR
jgi:hypothetical protein